MCQWKTSAQKSIIGGQSGWKVDMGGGKKQPKIGGRPLYTDPLIERINQLPKTHLLCPVQRTGIQLVHIYSDLRVF